jgi:hypothetical protein
MQDFIREVIDLAKQVEVTDPIDWGTLKIEEDETYYLITTSVIEQLGVHFIKGNMYIEANKNVMIASIVKLVVENFILNLKLTQKEENGN